jgi:ribosomal protein S12 methylthiotransferase accessory factor
MSDELVIRLAGNMKVEAEYKGFTVKTDQPRHSGGDDSAPSPFDLFLSSLGTCAGIFVVFFCIERKIPYEDIRMRMSWTQDEDKKLPRRFTVHVELPEGFPKKYEKALVKVVEQCTVERTIASGPEFEVEVTRY